MKMIDEIKYKLKNIKWTPGLIFELSLLLLIIASGGWLFLLLVGAVYPGHIIFEYEVEILSQILDAIFTYVCLMASFPRIKLLLGVYKIFNYLDNNFDKNNVIISTKKLDLLIKQEIYSDYLFLLPTLFSSEEEDPEIGNPIIGNPQKENNDNLFTMEYINNYKIQVRNGLVILRKVAILLNLNWIFQIPNTMVMLWYVSIIPCNPCAFENRPPQVIGIQY